jgi:hypothetical protein
MIPKRASAALPAAFASILFSAAVTVLLFFGGAYDWGADQSQWVLARIAPGGALGERPSAASDGGRARTGPVTWAIVDLGPKLCAPMDGAKPRCPPWRERTALDPIVSATRWVAARKPRLIVVDIMAAGSAGEADRLEAALGGLGVPILMALPVDFQNSADGVIPTLSFDETSRTLAGRRGSVRYVHAAVRSKGPSERNLLPVFRSPEGVNATLVPTLAYAVAMALGLPDDCQVDPRQSHASDCLRRFAQTRRVFSFPPVKPADGRDGYEPISRFSKHVSFRYLAAPRAEETLDAPEDLAGAVVLIGDTRWQHGEDRFSTGIGNISGAELQLNDIRQFAVAHPAPAGGLGAALWSELPFLGMGFAAVWLTQMIFRKDTPRPPDVPGASLLQRLRSRAKAGIERILRKVLVVAVAALLTVLAFATYLYLTPRDGRPPDFVMPFFGILLGFFLETLADVAGRLDRALKRAVGADNVEA